MTRTSKQWRTKRRNKIKGYKKIHNLILGGITGIMTVFFLLSLLCVDNLNNNILLVFVVSAVWLLIFSYANNLEHIEESE
jgi:hypothetical protein